VCANSLGHFLNQGPDKQWLVVASPLNRPPDESPRCIRREHSLLGSHFPSPSPVNLVSSRSSPINLMLVYPQHGIRGLRNHPYAGTDYEAHQYPLCHCVTDSIDHGNLLVPQLQVAPCLRSADQFLQQSLSSAGLNLGHDPAPPEYPSLRYLGKYLSTHVLIGIPRLLVNTMGYRWCSPCPFCPRQRWHRQKKK
jgi:hypothetical protein